MFISILDKMVYRSMKAILCQKTVDHKIIALIININSCIKDVT